MPSSTRENNKLHVFDPWRSRQTVAVRFKTASHSVIESLPGVLLNAQRGHALKLATQAMQYDLLGIDHGLQVPV